jgi:hypothetical protein
MEPEHRRAVRTRLAALLGQGLERVVPDASLTNLARDPRRLGQVLQTLQHDFGVAVDRRALASARTVNHLVTLVSDAVRQAGRDEAAPAPPGRLEAARDDGAGAAPPALSPPRAAQGETFTSRIAFEGERIHAVALYCSDGRIGDHMDDFLHDGLGLPRYDRLACPGGPVALSGRLQAFWECRGVEDQLRFLLRFHAIQSVVLVAHQPCAYYLERLRVPSERLEAEQQQDLRLATWVVERAAPELEVASFMAWVDGAAVRFEQVRATSALGERARSWGRGTR